jgi:hypothetical protein
MRVKYAGVILLVAMTTAESASAKGPTVELSITGPGLNAPIHTSDPDAIDASVWGGNFADWGAGSVAEPIEALPRFLVHFWVQLPRSGGVHLMYVVGFVWDPSTERGIVYLPGPRDEWYRTNTSSIWREGKDGHWFHATEVWGKALERVLRDVRTQRPNKSLPARRYGLAS